jgi:hypothetical protein
MARVPLQFPRIGAPFADLAAILAYVGPAAEQIWDGVRGRWQDGSTAGGIAMARQDELAANEAPVALSLAPGVPRPVADVTAATAIYLIPYKGRFVEIYNGTSWAPRLFASQLTLSLASQHLIDKNYDIFMYWDGSAVQCGTGPDWTLGAGAGSDLVRGTGVASTEIELHQGRWVNKNAIVLRNGASVTGSLAARTCVLVGTFRTTAAGQTEDSLAKRFLSAAYNTRPRTLLKQDATASWTYSTAAFRNVNNSAANRVSFVNCLPGRQLDLRSNQSALNSSATARSVITSIGYDASTEYASTIRRISGYADNARVAYPQAELILVADLGYHYAQALEYANGSGDTVTWYGVAGAGAGFTIAGTIEN